MVAISVNRGLLSPNNNALTSAAEILCNRQMNRWVHRVTIVYKLIHWPIRAMKKSLMTPASRSVNQSRSLGQLRSKPSGISQLEIGMPHNRICDGNAGISVIGFRQIKLHTFYGLAIYWLCVCVCVCVFVHAWRVIAEMACLCECVCIFALVLQRQSLIVYAISLRFVTFGLAYFSFASPYLGTDCDSIGPIHLSYAI